MRLASPSIRPPAGHRGTPADCAIPRGRPRGAQRRCLTLCALLFAGAVQAQTANGSESHVHTNATSADALKFHSALETYRPYREQAPESWRAANDTVGRIGGWRAYAREISGAAAEKPASAADPHAGHHGGGR